MLVETLGTQRDMKLIADPQYRGVIKNALLPVTWVRARFVYMNRTSQVVRLGSGEVRVQLVVMLDYVDPCNFLAVSWRLETGEAIVQQKSNPGKSTSAQCGNEGYSYVVPDQHDSRVVQQGYMHELFARFTGDSYLVVHCDERMCWRGQVKTERGLAGLRTDNACLLVDFEVG